MIDRRISAVWPHADDMDVLGLGQSEIYLQRLTPHAGDPKTYQNGYE